MSETDALLRHAAKVASGGKEAPPLDVPNVVRDDPGQAITRFSSLARFLGSTLLTPFPGPEDRSEELDAERRAAIEELGRAMKTASRRQGLVRCLGRAA